MARAIIFVAIGALGIAGTLVAAQEKPQIKNTVITPTPADDGKAMFRAYCAACHGPSGKGDGPAAPALKKTPPDLTGISARNGGVFPDIKVSRYIEGADELPAHGSRDMPVWGPALRSLPGGTASEAIRTKNLTDFLKSIQH